MKCHYAILNVERDVDTSEIKTAYRKAALKWHPDKNLDNVTIANEQFQLVQQAYEVLSDPQERAWYDKHREQILRGASSEYEDNSLDVFQYFTSTCFKGYGENETGFYAVYRKVFDAIIEEDIAFMENKDELGEIPRFGYSTSDYDQVVGPFYSYWMDYSTKKSYAWLEPYNIKDVKHRKQFKVVDKENKKVSQKAKKERNEEIRNLVAFVRKRDKRVIQHTKLIEAKIQENRKKQEEISKQRRLERQKELNESGAQAEWVKFDNVKSELEEIEKKLTQDFGEELSNSEDDDDVSDFYCVACNKLFKTEKAFRNHESSKKHKEKLIILKENMLEETKTKKFKKNKKMTENDNVVEGAQFLEEISTLNDEGICEFCVVCNKTFKTEKALKNHESSKEHKEKLIRLQKHTLKKDDDVSKDLNIADEDLGDTSSKVETKNSETNSKHNKNVQTATHNDKEKSEKQPEKLDDFASAINQKKKNVPKNKPTLTNGSQKHEESENGVITGKNKKKQSKKYKESNIDEIDTNEVCVTCKEKFVSKNKLFDHLKKTGHGVYLPTKNAKNKGNVRDK